MIIGIDFDGTCVSHAFPKVGRDIGAVPVLKKLVENGHKLILFTMRCNRIKDESNSQNEPIGIGELGIDDVYGNFLDDAILWFEKNDIPLYGIQTNPEQGKWTTSPKAYCHMYIDDAALGCPLRLDKQISDRVFVDWKQAESMLYGAEIIK